jgi:hypothetical protein
MVENSSCLRKTIYYIKISAGLKFFIIDKQYKCISYSLDCVASEVVLYFEGKSEENYF